MNSAGKWVFKIGGLERDPGKAGAVGLAEGVARKAHHHLPDLLDLFIFDTVGAGAGDKPLPVIAQLADLVFFGQNLAQPVGFDVVETGDGHGGFGDILLVDHDAVGLVENIRQQRMDRFPPAAAQAADVLADEGVGRRSDDAAVDDDVLEIADLRFLLQQTRGRALDVEAAHGVPGSDGALSGRVVFRLPFAFVKTDTVFRATLATASRITPRLRLPRRSIFTRPAVSRWHPFPTG